MGQTIRVRADLCAGMGLCVKFGPDVYKLDEHGYNMMDGQPVPEGLEAQAKRGALRCPESAIELVDDQG